MTRDDSDPAPPTEGARAETETSEAAPLTAKDASQIIRNTALDSLFALLKQSDFARAREHVFTGFRVSLDSLKTPIARGRLIAELIADPKLAEAMRHLHGKLRADPHERPENDAARQERVHRSKQDPPDHEAEQTRHSHELKEARHRIQELSGRVKNVERELSAEQAVGAALRAQLASEQNQNAWRERKMRRLERERLEARAALAERKHGEKRSDPNVELRRSPDANGETAVADRTQDNAAAQALDRLLSRGKYEAVELFVEEILRLKPADSNARRVRARLRVAQGAKPAALDDLRFVFDSELAGGDLAEAAKTLVMTQSVSGAPDPKMARALFAAVSKRPASAKPVADILRLLQGSASYLSLEAWCRPPLRQLLFASDGVAGPNGLPVAFRRAAGDETLTAQSLVRAIDRGDSLLVDASRRAVAAVDKQSRDETEAAIGRIADRSYFRLLARRELAGVAIVDASNVAHFERVLMESDKPALANILAVRQALRESGYFPVIAIGDANLPFTVDREAQLRAMIEREEFEIVTSGTDADEVIVREARRLHAVIVSNDYMADWDPAGEIEKIQYSISLTDGRATLYR